MKKLLKIVLVFCVLIAGLQSSYAQSTDAVQLNNYSFDKEEEVVRVSIKTTESFIIGANRYVLHIGGKYFLRNEHPEGRLDEIVFLIPLSDYETLSDKGEIVLVYGFYHANAQQDNEGSVVNGYTGKHWRLGTFTPQKF